MGVPVSKLKVTSQSVTLIVDQSPDRTASCKPDQLDHQHKVLLGTTHEKAQVHQSEWTPCDQTTEKIKDGTNKDAIEIPPDGECPKSAGYSQLKYIDDNETTSEENDLCRKGTENDTDSGNASISSDSHHEDSYEFESKHEDRPELSDDFDLSQLTLRRPRKRPNSGFNFYSTLTNRLSTISFANRCSTHSVLSQFEQSSMKKLISKLKPGDLIEIRCLCNCLKSGQLRASLNHRQRFRRTLQRQSFHQMPVGSIKSRPTSINLSNVFRRSCISGSMADLSPIVAGQSSNATFPSNDQCSEQFHYVFVQKVNPSTVQQSPNGENVWCFHVRPYQRVALLEDDRHLGVVKHESLDSIVGQFLVEMEERHWQFGRGFKQPKLSVYYQIRNQEKLSQQVLKQTLNAMPNSERVIELLSEIKDSYVRYHRTQCNSEHYATLWKYGIGWSTWVNSRTDIVRTLHHFINSFCQVAPSPELQLQAGECLYEQTNLIVHCFGLHGTRLEDSIRQWLQSQVVITKSPPSLVPLPPLVPTLAPNLEQITVQDANNSLNSVIPQEEQEDLQPAKSTETICVPASEAESYTESDNEMNETMH